MLALFVFKHLFQGQQFVLLRPGRLLAVVNQVAETLVVETHSAQTVYFGLDKDIGVGHRLFYLAGDGEPDQFAHQARHLLHIGIVVVAGGLDAYHNVGAHSPGDIHREVVAHTAVHQHHISRFHRGEDARDGHRCPQRHRQDAPVKDHLLARHQVGGHAGKRDGQRFEIALVVITHCAVGEQAVDFLPGHKTHWQHPSCRALGGQTEHVARHLARLLRQLAIKGILYREAGQSRLPVNTERYLYQIFGIFYLLLERDLFAPDVAGYHIVPVLACDYGIHLGRSVPHGIQAAHQGAHTGAGNHIHRNSVFFQNL